MQKTENKVASSVIELQIKYGKLLGQFQGFCESLLVLTDDKIAHKMAQMKLEELRSLP